MAPSSRLQSSLSSVLPPLGSFEPIALVGRRPGPAISQARQLQALAENAGAQAETLAALAMIDACSGERERAVARADEAMRAAEALGEPDVASFAVGFPVWNLLPVRVITAEVFPHLAPALPLPGARPPRCQRNHPQDTQNPAHRYTLLLRMSGVNYPTMRTGGRRTGGWRSPN
jgi:hypothetical protein